MKVYFFDTKTSAKDKFIAWKFNLKINNTYHYIGKNFMIIKPSYFI